MANIDGGDQVVVLFFLIFFLVHIWIFAWGYNDAEKRGKSGCLVCLLLLFAPFPVGLIIWLLIRPQK